MSERTVFTTGRGIPEMFCTLTSVPEAGFAAECEALYKKYVEMLADFSPVWLRLHLSDVTTQAETARKIFQSFAHCLILVGQPPANGARVALDAWHLSRKVMNANGKWHLENYDLHFFNTPELKSSGSFDQMHEEFVNVENFLAADGGTLENNLHRTWIYCRDVDNNYAGLVKARREYFETRGLTAKTHYIASTGIEGQSEKVDRLVRMDSLALFRHERAQIQYLYALENLSPTHFYGVTFERGTRIVYGDRSHYYISGTASIDKMGDILYIGDVEKQTERVLVNMEALLSEREGKLSDLKQVIIYMRDSADYNIIKRVVESRMSPETGKIFVRGPVCRPGWLVEIEGIAVNASCNPEYKDFI
ncbi:MAG: hypothetical protein E7042_00580 [Lentisphaerae bacterium]|nr:hypothetical protein [Lentisphaerota bacterium]